MKSFSGFLVAVALFAFALAEQAGAEPIVITGGSMLVTGRFETGSISISGTRGFSLRGGVDPGEGEVSAMSRCGQVDDFCLGGSTISIGALLGGSAFPRGIVTLDGVTYDDIDDINSPASALLHLEGSITLPQMQASPVVVTAPFTVGQRSVFSPPSPAAGEPIQGAGGTATLRLVPAFEVEGESRPWVLDLISYDFNDAAAIPEPATVLLVGAAVAGAWHTRRRSTRGDGRA